VLSHAHVRVALHDIGSDTLRGKYEKK